jgi:glutamate N-acetyltransferase / amino-acid N-acetyltransferase
MRAALNTCRTVAEELEIKPAEVLVASTGVIGVLLPSLKVDPAARSLARLARENKLNLSDSAVAAQAIMTTDTHPKMAGAEFVWGRNRGRIWATSKGSGMIHPNMATMLGFILTDVDLPQHLLMAILQQTILSF